MLSYIQNKNNIELSIERSSLDLAQTLDCGQCFRWTRSTRADGADEFSGIIGDSIVHITQSEGKIIFHDMQKCIFEDEYISYFDLDADYDAIKASLQFDSAIATAMEYAGGIRILKQPAFETLCSFIISQNNNIPRIKGCIEKLCERFGKRLQGGYGFPTAQTLCELSLEDLSGLSLGYRDEYIIDCAKKVQSGEVDLNALYKMELEKARQTLRTIKGVGPKVAECALLFGFHRIEAFPIDTWIKKALKQFYPDGFPQMASEYAGIAQQYLFHYLRTCEKAPRI